MVGITRFELVTSPLSGVRSNQLSYTPLSVVNLSNLNKCPYATGFYYFLYASTAKLFNATLTLSFLQQKALAPLVLFRVSAPPNEWRGHIL